MFDRVKGVHLWLAAALVAAAVVGCECKDDSDCPKVLESPGLPGTAGIYNPATGVFVGATPGTQDTFKRGTCAGKECN